MAEIQVRAANLEDLDKVVAFDHGYSTDYVWQMEVRGESGAEQFQVTFRPVRLPRPMRAALPLEPGSLASSWDRRACRLVAEQDGQLKGFLSVALAPVAGTAWIADFVVERRFRRGGAGSVLLRSAAHWARSNGLKRLVLEVQSKNYPAICFAQKHGLSFCGYNDRYFPNQDVALFFGMVLK